MKKNDFVKVSFSFSTDDLQWSNKMAKKYGVSRSEVLRVAMGHMRASLGNSKPGEWWLVEQQLHDSRLANPKPRVLEIGGALDEAGQGGT